jgi:hemin uptake protein HemP
MEILFRQATCPAPVHFPNSFKKSDELRSVFSVLKLDFGNYLRDPETTFAPTARPISMSPPDESNEPPRKAISRELKAERTTAEIFKGQADVPIHHGYDIYRLRLTKFGKLVRNK